MYIFFAWLMLSICAFLLFLAVCKLPATFGFILLSLMGIVTITRWVATISLGVSTINQGVVIIIKGIFIKSN